MKYTTALGLLFSGLAAAQSTTAAASGSSSTSLPGLVAQLPTCAVGCLSTAASAIGCAATDLACLCQSQERLVSSLTPCVLTAGCSTSDIADAVKVAPQICSQVQNSPDSAAIASASNLLTAALGTATATASSAASATASGAARVTPNAAARREYGLGMIGAAALAAAVAL